MDRDAEIAFRRELEASGEAQVRADFYGGGGLSTGGEDRRQIIRQWLRDKEKQRERKVSLTLQWAKIAGWAGIVGALIGIASIGVAIWLAKYF